MKKQYEKKIIENDTHLKYLADSARAYHIIDSVIKEVKTESKQANRKTIKPNGLNQLDTIKCPVEFDEAYIMYTELSTPIIHASFKNKSNKTIDAVKCVIECYNRFDEKVINPLSDSHKIYADFESTISPDDYGGGNMDLTFTQDATSKAKITVLKVHFTDGTVWSSNKSRVSIIAKSLL